MESFINVVSLVVSYFVEWFSSLTISLIQNPVIQLVFAFPVVFGIFYFIVNLIVSIFNRGNTGSNNSSHVYDPADEPERYLYSGDYDKDRWDYNSGGFDDGYDDPEYGPHGDLYDDTYDTGPF